MFKPIIKAYGPHAIYLQWPNKISPDIHDQVLQAEQLIHQEIADLIIETTSSYASVVLFLHPRIAPKKGIKILEQLNWNQDIKCQIENYRWSIPVCYSSDFGWDLQQVAKTNTLQVEDVIHLHTQQVYRIYFNGFLPGFLYLGGLHPKLHTPRKSTPRIQVPKGAVGIGGSQTGIYPQSSPGGWQIIGQTPVPLFNANQNPPTPFKPGDDLVFQSITHETFIGIEREVKAGIYQLTKAIKS